MLTTKTQTSLRISSLISAFNLLSLESMIEKLLRTTKKISVFQVTGLKNLGRVGTQIFYLIIFFLEKIKFYAFLKGISPFKMHKIIFFPENLRKILGFTSKFR